MALAEQIKLSDMTSIVCNGTSLDHVVYNGQNVWSKDDSSEWKVETMASKKTGKWESDSAITLTYSPPETVQIKTITFYGKTSNASLSEGFSNCGIDITVTYTDGTTYTQSDRGPMGANGSRTAFITVVPTKDVKTLTLKCSGGYMSGKEARIDVEWRQYTIIGDLFDMTSNSAPSPFKVTGYFDGEISHDVAPPLSPGAPWRVFSRTHNNQFGAGYNGSGKGTTAEIDLGRNYKNLTIEARTEGSGGHGELAVYYADTNQWVNLYSGYYEPVRGIFTTASNRPVRKIRIRQLYNSGDYWYWEVINYCYVVKATKA